MSRGFGVASIELNQVSLFKTLSGAKWRHGSSDEEDILCNGRGSGGEFSAQEEDSARIFYLKSCMSPKGGMDFPRPTRVVICHLFDQIDLHSRDLWSAKG
jgi:hypothetical protein